MGAFAGFHPALFRWVVLVSVSCHAVRKSSCSSEGCMQEPQPREVPREKKELICSALFSIFHPAGFVWGGEIDFCSNVSTFFFPIQCPFDFLLCFPAKLGPRISLLLVKISHHNRKYNLHFLPNHSVSALKHNHYP